MQVIRTDIEGVLIDPGLAIAWPDVGMPFVLSDKDARAPLLTDPAPAP